MITSQIATYPASVPHTVTLNDLRLRSDIPEGKKSSPALVISGMILVATLAVGAFVLLDPLGMVSPPEPKPAAAAYLPTPAPAASDIINEMVPTTPAIPVAKSIEAPVVQAPAAQTPVTRASAVRAPTVRQRSTNVPSKSRNSTEKKSAAPILLNNADDVKDSPKPALASEPSPAREETN